MKYAIVYWSRYGNGKKVVDRLATKLSGETKIFKTDEADPKSMPEADFYVFSAPAEAFRVQRNMRSFMKKLDGMQGKKYGIINTHGMDRNWLSSMEKFLNKKKMKMVAGLDFKVGKDANTGDALPDGWKAEVDAFANKLK
jgi:flavodoxin